jgi:flagellar basal-body rod protein FlgB
VNAAALLNAMTDKMRWHQQRQDLLSQNVANSDTPNYRGFDLRPIDFAAELDGLSLPPVRLSTDDARDLAGAGGAGGSAEPEQQNNFEVTPEGNGVTLEDEMMKVAANQMDYQAVTTLYTKSLQLIRTALGH